MNFLCIFYVTAVMSTLALQSLLPMQTEKYEECTPYRTEVRRYFTNEKQGQSSQSNEIKILDSKGFYKLTSQNDTVFLYNFKGGNEKEIQSFQMPYPVLQGAALIKNGSLLAVLENNNIISILDTQTQQATKTINCYCEFPQHKFRIVSLFSDDTYLFVVYEIAFTAYTGARVTDKIDLEKVPLSQQAGCIIS
ncbi:MAG: hypothetical protein H6679_00480 [Epsilonproteobacteria bacterium]|nr:hypothetical protein [Campylobacterota bacterium]